MWTAAEIATGEKCGLCHKEAFRLVERMALVPVKCCPRCARGLDVEAEEKTTREALRAMDRAERKRFWKERSFKWARSLHGKKVLLHYDVSDGYGGWSKRNCQVHGQAFRSGNASGGWGQVKVILDQSELHRVSYMRDYYWQGRKQIYYDKPIIDGFRWGLFLTDGWNGKPEKPLCFYLTWGMVRSWGYEVEVLDGEQVLTTPCFRNKLAP